MASLLTILLTAAILLVGILLRLFARTCTTSMFWGHKDDRGTLPRASKLVPIVGLMFLIWMAVDILFWRGSGHEQTVQMHPSLGTQARIESLLGFLVCSGMGVLLCVFPVAVIMRFLPHKIVISSPHDKSVGTIKIFGRASALFS
jgi:hypothetical protein